FDEACCGRLQVSVPAFGTTPGTDHLTDEETVAHIAPKRQRLLEQRRGLFGIASRVYDDGEVAEVHCEKLNIVEAACERRALHQERLRIRVLPPRQRQRCQVGLHLRRPSRIIELAVQGETFPNQSLSRVIITLV